MQETQNEHEYVDFDIPDEEGKAEQNNQTEIVKSGYV
jgi:hypothetical protein